jgi:hypothetical protein
LPERLPENEFLSRNPRSKNCHRGWVAKPATKSVNDTQLVKQPMSLQLITASRRTQCSISFDLETSLCVDNARPMVRSVELCSSTNQAWPSPEFKSKSAAPTARFDVRYSKPKYRCDREVSNRRSRGSLVRTQGVGGQRQNPSVHTRPTVFEDILRTDDSVAHHVEPTSNFLNRVAGSYWDQIRDVIEKWADAYPAGRKLDLVGRLRSPDNRQWTGAFWELYLHETFRRSDYEVSVHPTVPASRRQPDFLVTSPTAEFYVEAKSIFGKSTDGEDARLRGVFDEINRVTSPNFFVNLHVGQVGPRALSTKGLKAELETWLGNLDPDEVDPTDLLSETGRRYLWSSDGWQLEFRPMPIRAGARGRGNHRPLGMWSSGEARQVDDEGPLRNALKDKGSAYGKLDKPLLLALSVNTGFDRSFETMNALYGSAMVVFNRADPDSAHNSHSANGYFGSPGAWQHSHVAGVLIGPNIGPWIVASVAPTLWAHPSPVETVPSLDIWHHAALDGDRVETTAARRQPWELLGIAPDWPSGDPFPND